MRWLLVCSTILRLRKGAAIKRPITLALLSQAMRAPFFWFASTRSTIHGATSSARSARILKMRFERSQSFGSPLRWLSSRSVSTIPGRMLPTMTGVLAISAASELSRNARAALVVPYSVNPGCTRPPRLPKPSMLYIAPKPCASMPLKAILLPYITPSRLASTTSRIFPGVSSQKGVRIFACPALLIQISMVPKCAAADCHNASTCSYTLTSQANPATSSMLYFCASAWTVCWTVCS